MLIPLLHLRYENILCRCASRVSKLLPYNHKCAVHELNYREEYWKNFLRQARRLLTFDGTWDLLCFVYALSNVVSGVRHVPTRNEPREGSVCAINHKQWPRATQSGGRKVYDTRRRSMQFHDQWVTAIFRLFPWKTIIFVAAFNETESLKRNRITIYRAVSKKISSVTKTFGSD